MGVDHSVASRAALEWACVDAQHRGLPLHVVNVYSAYGRGRGRSQYSVPVIAPDGSEAQHVAKGLVAEALSRAHPGCMALPVEGYVVEGDPTSVLLELAGEADSLVIGTSHIHPTGMSLLSRRVATLIARAVAPVVVVGDTPLTPTDAAPVVVGITGRERKHHALSYGFEYARRHRTQLRVALCMPAETAGQTGVVLGDQHRAELWLFDALAEWRCRYPDVQATGVVIDAHPPNQLLAEASTARMLILSSGRRACSHALRQTIGRSILPLTCRAVGVVPSS